MRITKYIHSCLLIENESDKILFDPGLFSFVEGKVKPSQFTDLSAIILTHNHPDHIDADSLKEIIENNPNVVVLANTEIKNNLAEKQIIVEAFETGTRQVGKFHIEAFDAPHEKILADEIPQNTAYVIDNVFVHPGDSLAESVVKRSGTKFSRCRRWHLGKPNCKLSILPKRCRRNTSCRFTTVTLKNFFSNRVMKIFRSFSNAKISSFNG